MKAMIFSISAGCALFWGAVALLIGQNLTAAIAIAIGVFMTCAVGISLVCGQHR
jgi:hypothetical protein